MKLNKILTAIVAASSLTVSASAVSDIVNTWSYDTTLTFVGATFADVGDIKSASDPTGDPIQTFWLNGEPISDADGNLIPDPPATVPYGISPDGNEYTFERTDYFVNDGTNFDSVDGTQTFSAYELSWGAADGLSADQYSTPGLTDPDLTDSTTTNSSKLQNPTNDASLNRSGLTIGNPTLPADPAVSDPGFPRTSGTSTGDHIASGEVNTASWLEVHDTTTGELDLSGVVLANGLEDLGLNKIGNGNSLTHWNNTIAGEFADLTGGILRDTLTLTPVDPASTDTIPLPTIYFGFEFRETNNAGTCATGTDGNPTANPCGDLWGIPAIDADQLTQYFTYDGVDYAVDIVITQIITDNLGVIQGAKGLDELGDGQCAALGFDPGCLGFLTPEYDNTTVAFGFVVSVVPVPAAVWLFGSALLGFAGFKRYKENSAA